jgi:hypothetical protein
MYTMEGLPVSSKLVKRCFWLPMEDIPERFKGRLPKPDPLPEAVWINKPSLVSDGEVH